MSDMKQSLITNPTLEAAFICICPTSEIVDLVHYQEIKYNFHIWYLLKKIFGEFVAIVSFVILI